MVNVENSKVCQALKAGFSYCEKVNKKENDSGERLIFSDVHSVSKIQEVFEVFQNVVYDHNVPGGNVGLRRALNDFLAVMQGGNAKKTRLVLIPTLFLECAMDKKPIVIRGVF